MDRAAKAADDENKSDSENSSSSSNSSSSEQSSFKVASEKGSPSPKRGAKRKSSAGKAKAKSSSDKRVRGGGSTKKSHNADLEKFNSALDAAQKYLATLEELKCDTLWRSCIRGKEVERRLGRESAISGALETSMDSDAVSTEKKDEANAIIVQIENQSKFVGNMKEMCRSLRSMKSAELVAEVTSTSSLFKLLAADEFTAGKRLVSELPTLQDILLHVAKKLSEVQATSQFIWGKREYKSSVQVQTCFVALGIRWIFFVRLSR